MNEITTQEQIVTTGNTLVRLENETQMSVAIQRPRNEKEILSSALNELDIYPETAMSAIYVKPVGRKEGVMQFASSLSIRAAENIANRWSNSSYACDIVKEDNDNITLIAIFLDYERNIRHMLVKRVAKSYRSKTGDLVRYPPDRLDIVLSAAQSKLLREVILRSLPDGLKKAYEKKTYSIIEKRKEKMIEAFDKIGVPKHALEKYLDKKISNISGLDVINMVGIYNAIDNGELTKEFVFIDIKVSDKTQKNTDKLADKLMSTHDGNKEDKEEHTQIILPAEADKASDKDKEEEFL